MEQLPLPLHTEQSNDPSLRRAWVASGIQVPFQIAIHTPHIAVCLRRMAAADRRRRGYAAV